MTGLIVAMAILGAAVGLALAWPLIKRRGAPATRADYDLTVFRDQLAEIERDAAGGLLDAEAAEAARLEVQRRLLAADAERAATAPTADTSAPRPARVTAALVACGVPLAAAVFYLLHGSPFQPDQPYAGRDIAAESHRVAGAGGQAQTQSDPAQQAAEAAQRRDMEAAVARLEKKLEEAPDDIDGWLLLGRSYIALDRNDDAMAAYGKARALADGRPDVEVTYAEGLILAGGMKVVEPAAEIFRAVTEKSPFEPKSRYYLGLKKAQEGDTAGALQDWADLVAISEADAPWVPIVRNQIMRAAEELKIDPASVQMSEAARELIASQPPVLRPDTPILPPDAGTAAEGPGAVPGPSREQIEAARDMTPEEREGMIRGMVQRLADRMAENPDDLAGWQRLERAYRMMGETEKADDALAQIKRLSDAQSSAPTAPAESPPATQPGPTQEQMRAAQEMSPEDRAEMIRGMVQRLADRLAENPNDLKGWQRLERAYRVLGDTEKADEAAAQVKRLTP